jgi:XTP/dITP diphosphohydrolase
VYSARYAVMSSGEREGGALHEAGDSSAAPANSSDEANNSRLLREMAAVGDERRQARFVSVISAARDGVEVASFRGEANGILLHKPRGAGGFGYDPLFYFSPLAKTFAELTAEEKAAVSHRGKALRRFLEWCRSGPIG